jgi:hypothetical protein
MATITATFTVQCSSAAEYAEQFAIFQAALGTDPNGNTLSNIRRSGAVSANRFVIDYSRSNFTAVPVPTGAPLTEKIVIP